MACVGIIGTGFMGRTHCKAYDKISEVNKIRLLTVPQTLDDAKKLMQEHSKIISVETDTEKFFASDIDVVDICTPTATHIDLVQRAIAAGKPILCEKPLTLDSKTAQELVDKADKAKVPFMAAHVIRFWPEYIYCMRKIQDGSLGKLRNISMVRCSALPAWGVNSWFANLKVSGGTLFDLHVHDVDYLQFVLGRPKRVSSVGFKRDNAAYTDITTTLDFGDVYANVYASYELPRKAPFRMAYRALFENGQLDYELSRTPQLICYENDKEQTIDLSGQPDGYESECSYFIKCFDNNKMPELSSAVSAVATIKLLECIGNSADQNGKWMTF